MNTNPTPLEHDPIALLEVAAAKIDEIAMFAKIGKRFYDLAYNRMQVTCAESKKEATAYPLWIIVHSEYEDSTETAGSFHAGPFFSRKSAEKYLCEWTSGPKFCRVQCVSGKYTGAYEELLNLVGEIVGGNPN